MTYNDPWMGRFAFHQVLPGVRDSGADILHPNTYSIKKAIPTTANRHDTNIRSHV